MYDRLVFCLFSDFMAPPTLSLIVSRGCELLGSGARDVAQVCFTLMRKIMARSRDVEFAQHLQPLVRDVTFDV